MADKIINSNFPIRLFIIGAGFSAPTGAPVMSNFLNESRKIFVRDQLTYSRFKDVYEFQNSMGGAQRRLNIDLDNIETLYGLAEWGKNILKNGIPISESFDELISITLQNTINLSKNRILKRYRPLHNINYPWKKDDGTFGDRAFHNVNVYERFLFSVFEDGRKNNSINIFLSLNYDIILEKSLQRVNIEYEYLGLKEVEGVDLNCEKIYILKPHGSLNWIEEKKHIVAKDKEMESPIIIPPSWLKTVHSNSSVENTVKRIWKFGIGVIHEASELHILGFSLPDTDQYIRSLISFGLAANMNLTTVSVIDQSHNTLKKWAKLLTQADNYVDSKNSTPSDFVSFYCEDISDALDSLDWISLKTHVLGR